ncbi:MAG: hypothetical protein ACI9OO_001593 [Bacteroidia bacterium]
MSLISARPDKASTETIRCFMRQVVQLKSTMSR